MKQITNKQYDEYMYFKDCQHNGELLTPATMEIICESFDNDPEEIGKYILGCLLSIEQSRVKRGRKKYKEEQG